MSDSATDLIERGERDAALYVCRWESRDNPGRYNGKGAPIFLSEAEAFAALGDGREPMLRHWVEPA